MPPEQNMRRRGRAHSCKRISSPPAHQNKIIPQDYLPVKSAIHGGSRVLGSCRASGKAFRDCGLDSGHAYVNYRSGGHTDQELAEEEEIPVLYPDTADECLGGPNEKRMENEDAKRMSTQKGNAAECNRRQVASETPQEQEEGYPDYRIGQSAGRLVGVQ